MLKITHKIHGAMFRGGTYPPLGCSYDPLVFREGVLTPQECLMPKLVYKIRRAIFYTHLIFPTKVLFRTSM